MKLAASHYVISAQLSTASKRQHAHGPLALGTARKRRTEGGFREEGEDAQCLAVQRKPSALLDNSVSGSEEGKSGEELKQGWVGLGEQPA